MTYCILSLYHCVLLFFSTLRSHYFFFFLSKNNFNADDDDIDVNLHIPEDFTIKIATVDKDFARKSLLSSTMIAPNPDYTENATKKM